MTFNGGARSCMCVLMAGYYFLHSHYSLHSGYRFSILEMSEQPLYTRDPHISVVNVIVQRLCSRSSSPLLGLLHQKWTIKSSGISLLFVTPLLGKNHPRHHCLFISLSGMSNATSSLSHAQRAYALISAWSITLRATWNTFR